MRTYGWPLVLALLVSGCMGRAPMLGVETTGLDRKLTTFSYIEEGRLVSLIVDVRAARLREGEDYLPLEICVANQGLASLTLTRESFQLIDEDGNRYALAGAPELLADYHRLDQDRDLQELAGVVDLRFSVFTRYPSKFFPTRTGPGVVRDKVQLPKFSYIVDRIYFPMPRTGLIGRRFELHLDAAGLEDPVFVRFAVE